VQGLSFDTHPSWNKTAIMDALRRSRKAVSAASLASTLKVSVRTLYRDMQALKDLGAPIEGEAGIGYILRPGYFLPPLMFTREELEALVLGARWVGTQPDEDLTAAAKNALGKIAAAAPSDLRAQIDDIGLWPIFFPSEHKPVEFLTVVRKAMTTERTLALRYADAHERVTERHVWPVQIGFHENVQTIIGWCLLRKAFRTFRADRIHAAEITAKPYGKPRRILVGAWDAEMRKLHPEWFLRLHDS
jgi:predicted DNA-binding transcriptional regulator YafY